MTKKELLEDLQAERNAVVTAFNFSYIVGSRCWERDFKTFTLNPGTIDFDLDRSNFRYTIERPADLVTLYDAPTINNAAVNLIRITIRTALSQCYERIQEFCLGDGTRQPKWEKASWRPIARLARNSFSHNFKLNFIDQKTGKLRSDVKFEFPRGRIVEIKNTEHGKPIDGSNMPVELILGLLDVMAEFVRIEL
jgi:hypothetical protein